MCKVNNKATKTTPMARFGVDGFIVNFENISHLFSSVFIVNFEQVNTGWDGFTAHDDDGGQEQRTHLILLLITKIFTSGL